jgi:hypothetical protein
MISYNCFIMVVLALLAFVGSASNFCNNDVIDCSVVEKYEIFS